MLGQLVVSGLAAGSLYGIMALGLILIYKSTHVLNFGQGDMTMFSTLIACLLLTAFRWLFPAAMVGALLAGAFLGVVVDRGDAVGQKHPRDEPVHRHPRGGDDPPGDCALDLGL